MRGTTTLIGTLMAACALAPASHAATITYEQASAAVDDHEQSSASAYCPNKTLGGGVHTTGTIGQAYLVGALPVGSLWRGRIDTFADISVSVLASCLGGQGEQLSFKSESKNVPPDSTKSLTVKCPAGSRATGGASSIGIDYLKGELKMSRPIDGGRAWQGRVRNFSAEEFSMNTDVVCARGRLADRLYYRDRTRRIGPDAQGVIQQSCRAGDEALGGGAAAIDGDAVHLQGMGIATSTGSVSIVDNLTDKRREATDYLVCHG